jgi:hypothetical protein
MTKQELKEIEEKDVDVFRGVREKIVKGYAKGKYGLSQDPEKLLELANKGWIQAQHLITSDIYKSDLTVEEKIEELEIYALLGWEPAKYFLCEIYAGNIDGVLTNPKMILEKADLGWVWAQHYVCHGYTYGMYGFPKDEDKLNEMIMKGYKYIALAVEKAEDIDFGIKV